jgi:hypothetical protein
MAPRANWKGFLRLSLVTRRVLTDSVKKAAIATIFLATNNALCLICKVNNCKVQTSADRSWFIKHGCYKAPVLQRACASASMG